MLHGREGERAGNVGHPPGFLWVLLSVADKSLSVFAQIDTGGCAICGLIITTRAAGHGLCV